MVDTNIRADYAARAAKALNSSVTATDPEMAEIYLRVAESYAELAKLMPRERTTLPIVPG